MENKARYTLVGFFVLTFSIAMVAFVLWLARIDINKETIREYRLYVTKSISGLKPKSIVYYKGLEIGSVKIIQVNPKNLEEIEVILSIKKPDLVKSNTFAQVESQGVTGNKIIELAGGTHDAKLLQANSDELFVIPIKNTFLDNLTNNATNITDKADLFLSKLNAILNENNMKGIESLIENTNNTTKSFDNAAANVTKNLDSVVLNINKLINDDIKKSLNNIDNLSEHITIMSSNINDLIKNDIKNILQEFKQTAKSAQNIDEVIVEFENSLIKLNNTVDNFNLNSGNMIFNTREIKYGPGETTNK